MTRSSGLHAFSTLGIVFTASVASFAPARAQEASTLQFGNLERTVTIAHDKFTALADAMPEGTFPWRPMEGVRSVSDVYIHVSADNFFVPTLMGLEAPRETGITNDVLTFRAHQEREMSKAEIVDAVDASFRFLLSAMESTRGELNRTVTLGGSDTTVGDLWIRAITHIHEHLGQSIAYARTNGVVPPWSG
jgi:hypothetical protein